MQKTMRVAAHGVLTDSQGRMLLRSDAGTLQLPGGTVEHGEQPAEAVVREFFDQTGLEVKPIRATRASAATVELTADHSEHNTLIRYQVELTGGEPRSGLRRLPLSEIEERSADPITAALLDLDGATAASPYPRSDLKPGQVQRVGVYAWITDPAGRVLITLISEGFPAAGKWHLPGGGLDFGEQPPESLLREIVEETSQDAELRGLRNVDARHNRKAAGRDGTREDFHGIHIVYDAVVAEPKPLEILDVGGSTAEARWMHLDELLSLPITPAVEAALSALRHN